MILCYAFARQVSRGFQTIRVRCRNAHPEGQPLRVGEQHGHARRQVHLLLQGGNRCQVTYSLTHVEIFILNSFYWDQSSSKGFLPRPNFYFNVLYFLPHTRSLTIRCYNRWQGLAVFFHLYSGSARANLVLSGSIDP